MSITHITKCLLCPPEKQVKIVADEIPQVRPGEQPPEAVGKYVNALSSHLQKRHPEAFQRSAALSQVLFACLVLQNFDTTDPGVETGRDQTRAFIHRLTRKNDLNETDLQIRYETICGMLDGLGIDGEGTSHPVIEQLRDLRNFLLEEGEYAPAEPVTQKILVAP